MALSKVSATKIEQWLTCPYGYHLKYVKSKKGGATRGMVFGNIVHKICEDLNRWMNTQTFIEDDPDMFKKLMTKAQYITAQRNKSKQKQTPAYIILNVYIRPYIKWVVDNKIYMRDLEPEKNFAVPIEDIAETLPKEKLHVEWEKYRKIKITGKIDLHLPPNIVLDFKTQDPLTFAKSWTNNFQVILYTLIFDRDMDFIYMFLNKSFKIKLLGISKEGRIEKFNKLIEVIHSIETAKSYTRRDKACSKCLYKNLCDRYTKRRIGSAKKRK